MVLHILSLMSSEWADIRFAINSTPRLNDGCAAAKNFSL
jgi:hypothetical protein